MAHSTNTRVHLVRAIAVGFALLSAWLFLLPGALVVRDLADPALGEPGISERTLALHRSLSERITPWARERIASGEAGHTALHDVPTNEWPIFTCVFFLDASYELQAQGVDISYADEAILASRDLIMDPVHHTWVRTHWGDDYLHDRNVFFRSLLIGGLTRYMQVSGDETDMPFLRDQVETLSAELDASPHGVLEDYPGETYPIDVLAAIAYIDRADDVLGTDHTAFVARARRAFVAPYDDNGLVRFRVDLPSDGSAPLPVQGGRGIGNSWVGIYATDLWPEDAERWYAAHDEGYWQETWWATGFREFPRGTPDWTFEIDAGPIVGGFGTSASAFGIGAARRSGRLDQAYELSTQMVATAWPQPDGSLLMPQKFSHDCAPMLGEAGLAYFSSLQPAPGVQIVRGGALTALVGFCLLFYFGWFALSGLLARRVWRGARRSRASVVLVVPIALLVYLWGGLGLAWMAFGLGLLIRPSRLSERDETAAVSPGLAVAAQ